jgi:hypothetical protein
MVEWLPFRPSYGDVWPVNSHKAWSVTIPPQGDHAIVTPFGYDIERGVKG